MHHLVTLGLAVRADKTPRSWREVMTLERTGTGNKLLGWGGGANEQTGIAPQFVCKKSPWYTHLPMSTVHEGLAAYNIQPCFLSVAGADASLTFPLASPSPSPSRLLTQDELKWM